MSKLVSRVVTPLQKKATFSYLVSRYDVFNFTIRNKKENTSVVDIKKCPCERAKP